MAETSLRPEEVFADVATMAKARQGIELNIKKTVSLTTKRWGTIMFAAPKSPLFRRYADVERGIVLGAVHVDSTREVYTYADRKSTTMIPKGAWLLRVKGKLGKWITTHYVDKDGKVVVKTNQVYVRKLPRLEPVEPDNEPKAVITELPGVGVIVLVQCANEHDRRYCFYIAPADATYVYTGK